MTTQSIDGAMPPLPEPVGYVCPSRLADLKAGRCTAINLVSKDEAQLLDLPGHGYPDIPVYLAAPLLARVAELQAQNEAQKDEWLSWNEKRDALELFASRWQQLEYMYLKGATANTLGHYIGRPERLDYAAKLRAEHDAALAAHKEQP